MSRPSLVRQVLATSTGVLVVTLLVVGALTGGVLHVEQERALDATLLAAAHAEGVGGPSVWESEHVRSPVDVRVVVPGTDVLPEDWVTEAVRTEQAVWRYDHGRRVLLLPMEREESEGEGERDADGDRDEHALVLATAPEVSIAETAGRFVPAYGLVAGLAALVAILVERRLLLRAVEPLARASRAVARVMGAGQGARVSDDGPAEVHDLLSAVNALLARLDDAFQAQARFTAEAAHELRTPVTAMLGELDVTLRRARTSDEYERALASVREEVVRLGALVEGLMTLARVDSGQAEQGRELVAASQLAAEAARREGAALTEAGCALDVDVRADRDVRVHHALLVAALGNLLRNASHYAAGKPVRLTVDEADGHVRFVVDDHGPGVPPDQREALFDRFARGGEARRGRPNGLGLGLPLAREVARRHGGDVWIEAAPGGGCRAILAVPTT